MLSNIAIDIYRLVLNFLKLNEKLNFKKVCKKMKNIYLIEIIDDKYSRIIDEKILKNETYQFIQKLNLCESNKIFDLNFLTKLKELDCSFTEINDNNIKELNLEHLSANNCKNITNINHMSKLKILDVSGNCGVNDYGIKNLLNIVELNASENTKITNVNHMLKLKILDAIGNCGVNDYGIKNLLNVIKLNASSNTKITNVNHMLKLEILGASGNCGVNDYGIKNLLNIVELIVSENTKITNINHMTKLKILYTQSTNGGINNAGISGINDAGIKN